MQASPAYAPTIRRTLLAGLLLAGLALQAAWADGRDDRRENRHHDHERARAAVQAGEVLPLPVLLERLQRSHPGRVLELELEREDGLWVYEVKLLQADGQLLKLELDARTADVLKIKRKRRSGGEDRPPPASAPAASHENPAGRR